jgi:hypothetical protein
LNEKLKIEPALDPDSPEARTRSDVAPKQKQESGTSARHISGLRPAVHLPAAPSVPPPPLTPEDLLEEGWDDEDEDSGPTLLDSQGSVPRELVAEARALHDPLGETREREEEREPETREVGTREVPTRAFSRDEAPTGEMPTVLNPAPAKSDDDEEFNHDDFPTRQTPMGLQEALLAYPLPSDSHRGLHETMDAVPSPLPSSSNDSFPDLPSSPSLGPTIAAPIAPLSPLRSHIALPQSPMAMPMHPPTSPDETAQMPNRPALRLDDLSPMPPPVEPSSISQISQISNASYPSSSPMPLMYPTPTSITGAPLPPASTVRFAFLKNLSPNNDPPLNKLLVVGAISFFATLVLSSFIAWVVVLVRH